MYDPESARKWRLRAEQLRLHAVSAKNPAAAQAYTKLAEEWDRKAAAAETRPEPLPIKGGDTA